MRSPIWLAPIALTLAAAARHSVLIFDRSQGKGLGRYVSLACLHHLYERGEAYCTLWTVPGRAAAVRLYTKLGFVEIAAMRAYEYQCPHRS